MIVALDRSDGAQILAHLKAADASFVPALSARIDLERYAEKLAARARRIEAWDGERLAGLVAMYADDAAAGGFITNVSVTPDHQGRGIAGELLGRAIELGRELGLPRVRLEVHADNAPALRLYARMGFLPEEPGSDGPNITLQRAIR